MIDTWGPAWSGSRIGYVLWCLLLSVVAPGKQVFSQDKIFKAGASIGDITPMLGSPIVGNYIEPPATFIHDPLHVRTLVLNDGEETLVFSIVDNVSVKREVFDAAKAMVQNRLGIPYQNMLCAATHTHSGTSAEKEGIRRRGWQYGEPLDDYQRFVAQRIADGVQNALMNLRPAKIGWGSVNVPEHVFNRRWIMRDSVMNPLGFMDAAKMNPGVAHPDLIEPAGPVDPEVFFLAVQDEDGNPLAVLANYALHYVGGVPKGHISADYFAVFAERIKELLGADRQTTPFVGILTNGTSGDINNINWPGPKSEGLPPYEKMHYVANDVAHKVYDAYKSIAFEDWVDLQSASSELTLNVRRASPEILANMERVRNRPNEDPPLFHPLEKIYADRVEILEDEWPDKINIVLQTFKIGDLAIAAAPFEVFAEIGLEIKEKSPFHSTFIIELANGAYGYLPSPGQHQLGGYETWLTTNRVQKDASDLMILELIRLFKNIR
ncbi:MAG: neutral/alkaline non-lysosomal ceramidase N-terminal domain-containing protein [Saprospiraceae bacterium]|nr:neutral/alkaline non-lysosomal ceramidase N-terminal domain-containing protein [Saprospiraceae bacterium]